MEKRSLSPSLPTAGAGFYSKLVYEVLNVGGPLTFAKS